MLRKKLAQSAVAQQPYAPVSSDQSITSMEPSQASASGQPLIQASNESSTAAAKQTEAVGQAAKVPFSALSNTTPSKQPFSAVSNTTPSKQPVTPASKSHWRLEDGDRPSRALQVVHELHSRYMKQTQRWRDYAKLFTFLGFVALFLSVLYLQRGAQTAYEVYSTVDNAIVPSSLQYGSSDDVLNWLQSTLTLIWTDPVCGDGDCEEPFEYPSYGSFGCRADCGRLTDVYNVTTLQIDLYFDFTHPTGSVPATELLSQAAWNLCPVSGVPSGNACYYSSDQTFDALTGSVSIQITDCPDGDWELDIKRDLFNKVAGGVRRLDHLTLAAELEKIQIALQVANVQRSAENSTLTTAVQLATTTAASLVNTTISVNYTTQFNAIQASYAANTTNTSTYYQQGNQTQLWETYTLAEFAYAFQNCNISGLNSLTAPNTGASWTETDPWTNQVDATSDICNRWNTTTATIQATQLSTVQTLILGRLDNATSVGTAALAAALSTLAADSPEISVIVVAESGQDPINDPYNCVVSTLATFYVDGYNPIPPVAKAALTRTVVLSANVTQLAALSNARITELANEAAAVLQLPEVLAAAAFTLSNPLYAYNYVTWTGGANSYETCDLTDRAPQYVGACSARTTCNSTTDSSSGEVVITYNCNPAAANTTACGRTCDMQATCDALCVCQNSTSTSTCTSDQVCVCSVCSSIVPADEDPNYTAIIAQQTVNASASASTGRRKILANPPGPHRELLQTTTAAPEPPPPPAAQQTLQQILSEVTALQSGQVALQSDITSLQTDVDAANEAAAARAEDSSLQTLITQARADIATGQAEVQALLTEIIGKQNQAAASAEQTAASLAAIQDLQAQQAQAQQDIANAVQDQITAIQSAYQQGLISPSQALELWKTARIDQGEATKLALLSNDPCSTAAVQPYDFTVDNYNYTIPNAARRREMGLSNRLIAGMLLQTTRTTPINCTDSRFNDIESQCKGEESLAPYGVDPVFKLGTDLYNPDLDNTNSLVTFYNCSELTFNATYNVRDPDSLTYATTNAAPFCAELYNARDLPYGFRSFNLVNLFGNGFPIWFDINLAAADAQTMFEYVQEGLYYDSNTQQTKAIFVSFNADLQLFTQSIITFQFTDGGSIMVDYTIDTLKVQLYSTTGGKVRLVLEVILFLAICANIVIELRGWAITTKRKRSPLTYFRSGWHVVDFVSVVLLFTAAILWTDFVIRLANPFDIEIRYDVYESLQAQAAFLKLNAQGLYLREVQAAFASLGTLVHRLSWYYAINGVNILLLIARILKLMDFQPRLGVVTRSLALAGPDLIHFVLVCGMVFIGYAMMAHLIFGNTIEKFATFGSAVNTCFAILLGDISVNDDLKMLSGLQGVAATLFFWSFELLVFMVLLNFLLAIIVDAFSEVKENTHETTGLHTEVSQMIREQWRSLMASTFKGRGIPDSRLRELLDQWEGEDPQTLAEAKEKEEKSEMHEKRLRILGEEMNTEELKEVLQACLHDMLPQDRPEASKPSLWNCWRPKPPAHAVNEEELDKAAEYVVSRFGVYSDDEEESDNEDEWEGGKKKDAHAISDAQLEKEREQLAKALERLADVQHELADGQRNLMNGQRQLAEQQRRLVSLINPQRPAGVERPKPLTATGSVLPPEQGDDGEGPSTS